MLELEQKMESNKETIFDKEYVKVKKYTFDSMNKVIKQTKKVMEIRSKIQKVYKEVDEYAKSYKYLEKGNENIQKEVKYLRIKNQKLEKENDNLISYIKAILKTIKDFLNIILAKPSKIMFLFSKLRNENKIKSLSPLSLACEQNVLWLFIFLRKTFLMFVLRQQIFYILCLMNNQLHFF